MAESPEVIIVTVRCGPYESLMSGLQRKLFLVRLVSGQLLAVGLLAIDAFVQDSLEPID